MNAPDDEAAIFAEALRLPPEERAAYLAQATHGNAELRQRVESLLGSYQAGEFLEQAASPQLRQTLQLPVPPSEKPGDRIGRYKLLEQIGEGGCGVVYVAEQTDPVRRRVALKIIKLGMDTKSVTARFEAERQALALMDHPCIAKVFDAGATETGRPYFVMELVRGIKITDYCDEKKLSPRARLDLFIQVCQAIQHAHQKGIIHRDIKPSNILVTVNDGVAVPKIIDFGIAKATSGQVLTDKTVYTAFEQFIGTPAYMSPEQAVLTSLDIDTRSDIYALGVLLYELLTGKTPFDAKELLAIGLDEMRRTIRETEPLRPSTRVSTLPGQELSTTAHRRGLEAPELVGELRSDLDWIVMKCLEKDRARRYETANGLAMDIQRHLDNEPVVARPPSAVYRFRKLVRRNKLAFMAAGAIAAALLVGLSVSTWMFFEEKAARQRAVAAERNQTLLRQEADLARTNEVRMRLAAEANENKATTEAAKSQMVAQFLKDMLQSIRPSVAIGRDTTLIREMLDQTAERVGRDLADQPEVQADLQTTIAEVYRAIGKDQKAEMIQRRVVAARQATRVRGDPEVARALNHLALILWPEGEGTGLERWQAERRKMGGWSPDDFEPSPSGPDAPSDKERLAEAERLHRQALAIRRETGGNENLETTESLNNLALVLRREGKLEEAEALQREALASRRKILTGDRLPVAESLDNLAVVLRDCGKLAEAETHLRESLGMRRRLLGTADASVARTVHHLADVLERLNDVAGLESLFREELTNAMSRSPNKPLLASDPVYAIVDVLLAKNQYGQVDQLVRDLLAPAIQKAPENVGLLRTRGESFARRGRWSEAAADLARVIKLDPETHDPWYHLAPLLLRTGATNDYHRLCHEMLLRFGGENPPQVAERTVKACLLLPPDRSDLALATELAQTAVVAGLDHPFIHYYQFAKGLAEYRQGHYAGAEDWLRKSLAGNDGENLTIPARLVLAMTCRQLGKTNEARFALDEALALAEPSNLSRSPDAEDFTDWWHDLLIFQILRDEAKALVGTDGTADGQPFLTFSEAHRLVKEGQPPEAEAALREVVTRYKALFGPEHPLLIDPLGGLGQVLERQQKLSEAEAAFRECLALSEKDEGKRNLFRAQAGLVRVLVKQENREEGERVARRSLEVARSFFGDEHPEVAECLHALANAISRSKISEAESLCRQALAIFEKTGSEERPNYAYCSCKLGDLLGGQGKFAEAAAQLVRVRKLIAENHELWDLWDYLPPLLFVTGQLDAYREQCRQNVERFGRSADPLRVEWTAKNCLILPDSGVDLGVVAQLADTAAAATNHWATGWFQLGKGLAEYRQGRFASAVEWANRTLNRPVESAKRSATLDVEAYMVLAMAQYRLQQTDEARAALAKGVEIERTKLAKLESGNLGGGWLEWIIAHALMREAQALIEGASTTAADTK
ncbi:MAG TPA: tetratricopeptide repeat protein [Verrucomicrobiota bacterium]|nr:tetratricopeptide repeat protein [Verrucomicrobiota bacterium]